MKGIYTAKKTNGDTYYRASITYRSKHIALGSSGDMEEAAALYTTGRRILDDTSYEIDSFDEDISPLSFEKYVILVNFRDNGICFKTPIYLHRSYFSYFLDPNNELKFDLEDLFYYSSHKIQRRGNHLFVADFGLQERILARYDIPAFGVAGKDYEFKNGDPTDLRYANINVINPVKNIMEVKEGRDTIYKVRIHLNGNWTIGSFPTHEMATIAYNKALDEAKKHGLKTRTEILDRPDGVSHSLYAKLYSTIKLPQKYIDHLSAYDIKQMS